MSLYLWAALIGLGVGLLGRAVLPKRLRAPIPASGLFGVGGAVLGSLLVRVITDSRLGFGLAVAIGAVVGAVLVLLLSTLVVQGRQDRPPPLHGRRP